MPAKNLQRITEGGTYCHVYNKGIENRTIFADEADYHVFLSFLEEYLSAPKSHENNKKDFIINGRVFRGVPHQPKNYFNKVELIAYSLKPDHFHLLLHQKTQKSLQAFIRSLCTRYSIYFNKKYNRTGTLFDGPYKSAQVNDEKGLLLLTHYLHKASDYSSYPEYLGHRETPWVNTKIVLSKMGNKDDYKQYIETYEPNQEENDLLDEITIEKVDQHLERSDLEEIVLKPWSRIPELLVASTIFVLLLGFGLKNVTSVTKNQEISQSTLGTKAISASPTPSAMPNPKTMLTVRITDTTAPVNIRRSPTTGSEKIDEAHGGDVFEFVSKNSDWYEVKLPDGSTGFIFSKYIETEEKK